MSTASGGGSSISYTYDADGIRTSKTVNGTKHTYYYAGGKLLRETFGSNTLDFFYDVSGNPYALKHNGTTYYYITNLQGDVMSIVNGSGTVVASYQYDPFGNLVSTEPTANSIGAINPLRYRGYVYDTESRLYYLQSRYYDPKVGRFINADALVSTGQGVLGFNMFAYCLNNPVNGTDVSGSVSLWYYLIVDSDYGFIHRTVQLHIVGIYGILFAREVTLGGYGRADIVKKDTGEVWEVKHAANDPVARTAEAVAQASKYIGGTHGNVVITSLGSAESFNGSFYIKCGNYSYLVEYWTPQAGAILYSVKEVKNYDGEYFAVYVPKEVREKSKHKEFLLSAGFLLGFALSKGTGGGLGWEYSCFDDALAY